MPDVANVKPFDPSFAVPVSLCPDCLLYRVLDKGKVTHFVAILSASI